VLFVIAWAIWLFPIRKNKDIKNPVNPVIKDK
jgi:hypothetical protein